MGPKQAVSFAGSTGADTSVVASEKFVRRYHYPLRFNRGYYVQYRRSSLQNALAVARHSGILRRIYSET